MQLTLAAYGFSPSASALTYDQKKACYSKYNGKIVAIDDYDKSCNEVCTPKFSTSPTGDLTNPGGTLRAIKSLVSTYPPTTRTLQAAAASTVTNIYYTALADKFCRPASNTASDVKIANECKSILKSQVTTCMNAFYENGYEGSSTFTFPDINIDVSR